MTLCYCAELGPSDISDPDTHTHSLYSCMVMTVKVRLKIVLICMFLLWLCVRYQKNKTDLGYFS